MALSDGPVSVEQVERAQAAARERRVLLERAIADEQARATEPREFVDEMGCMWRYIIFDDAFARIESCEAAGPDLAVPILLGGRPVAALAAEACAHLEGVERIVLPDAVASIGSCAFRGCGSLKGIAFPAELERFDSDWLRGCAALEEVALPGGLEKIAPSVFDIPRLKRLKIGAGTREVLPAAFQKSQLESIEVDSANPFLWTDGRGIYTADRETLLALALPVERYAVAEGCKAIAKKGLSSFAGLAVLDLPETLEVIGDYACTKTGIRAFTAPPQLKAIGERAFFACAQLEKVVLNPGVVSIGENAFTGTAVRELFVPASVREIGFPVAAQTAVTYSGPDATFRIDGSSASFKMDEAGGLYRVAPDGLHFMKMLEPEAQEYAVDPACVAIDEGAFLKHAHLRAVELSEGLRFIGAKAFRDCRALEEANLPETLEELGDEAFLGANLASVRIPAQLGRIGSLALVSEGAFHGMNAPSLIDITVAEGNPRFRIENGLLVERMDAGFDRVLACPANLVDAVIPVSVKAIAPYAFSGVRALRSLSLTDGITMVEAKALGFDSMLERIHIDLAEPIEGHAAIDLDLPATARAAQQMMLAFGSSPFVNVEDILAHYDNSILNAAGFDAATEARLQPYEQVKRILARMRDPLLMTPANRSLAARVMAGHFEDFCLAIARHDDREAMQDMLDLGYIDADSIAAAIECVAPVQDASITNFLLDAKQRRFGQAAIDFDADFAL